jgi:predicted nucleotidyltransferase
MKLASPSELGRLDPGDRAQLSALVERLRDLRYVESIILFGSLARGEPRPDSDMDILLVVDKERAEDCFPEVSRRLVGIDRHRDIGLVVTNWRDMDAQFYRNVLSEGMLLHGDGRVPWDALGYERFRVIIYDASRCAPKARVRITKTVRGWSFRQRSKRGSKLRSYPGLAARGEVLLAGRATLLAPEKTAVEIATTLRRLGARVTALPVWR